MAGRRDEFHPLSVSGPCPSVDRRHRER
jgi:hypothetical protein